MFCYQCEETLNGKGCTKVGVCGKKDDVATLQDLLIYTLKGISFWAVRARNLGLTDERADLAIIKGLFATVTNVNFDPSRFVEYIKEELEIRDNLKERFLNAYKKRYSKDFKMADIPDCVNWKVANFSKENLLSKGAEVGILSDKIDEDVRSLREFMIISLKGMAAYMDHAYILGFKDDELFAFVEEALEASVRVKDVGTMFDYVVKTGKVGLKAMELLDRANTSHYGNPEPTMVNIGVKPGPAALISGHDLKDLEDLLEQTKGTGVNVYTHGEMLPANAYPYFKKYDNLAGNYGNAWWMQNKEFESFNGPIIMTTNCLTPPSESYKWRVFTTGLVGWPDVKHIPDRTGDHKDFSAVIKMALEIGKGPVQIESGKIPIGYARNTVLEAAGTIAQMVKDGKIKRFFVLSGCDGRFKSREYYTTLATKLPKDTVILTSGCAKYRYNKLDLGQIEGLPRILDAGQCNDSYTWIATASKLAEIFGAESVNDLPISFDLAWYEQKAAFILNVLLSLGVKNIRLGPTLPAFVSPNILNVLVEKFQIKPNGNVDSDLEMMMQGK